MCGIAGLIGFGRTGRENMEKMRARMVHRGPDAGGTWVSPDGLVVLGHQRLSILDLSDAGAQPFTSASGRFTIVYNGEIYNFADVKKRLLSEHRVSAFRSTCDTEVLVEAIEAWGVKETLSMCRGMFAFGLFDRKERTITLARDRVGEKPLYYGYIRNPDGGRAFAFASDVGSIAAVDGFDAKVDKTLLHMYFEHGYYPAPYSVYVGIYKLVPGTWMRIWVDDFARKETHTYWSVKEKAVYGREHPFTGTRKEAADELERLLRASIRGQMISDVPLGAFLSAGIDSGTIVALMQEESGSRKVRSFTIGMQDPKYNEAAFAKQIAEHIGTDHTEMYITEADAKAVIPLLPHMFSEPFADSSEIPTFLVSKLTRQHVTVSLSGDAGDELFCGYNSYTSVERKWGKNRKVPAPLRKAAGNFLLHGLPARKEMNRERGKLLLAESPEDMYRLDRSRDPLIPKIALVDGGYPDCEYFHAGPDTLGDPARDISLMDMEMYHPDDILVKVDRTAMAVSLETRVPFLDRDVVEFAWTLPMNYLRGREGPDGSRIGKLLLRDVLYRYVPKELMDRPKKGFSVPMAKWLRESELRSWAERLISRRKLVNEGFLNPDVVWSMWDDLQERGIWREQIWFILMFEAWLENEYRGF